MVKCPICGGIFKAIIEERRSVIMGLEPLFRVCIGYKCEHCEYSYNPKLEEREI